MRYRLERYTNRFELELWKRDEVKDLGVNNNNRIQDQELQHFLLVFRYCESLPLALNIVIYWGLIDNRIHSSR